MSNNFSMNKLKIRRNKMISIAVALFLMLSMTASLVLIPTARAAAAPVVVNHYSYVYVAASPAPPAVIGLGQQELLVLWTADIPPDVGETAGLVTEPSYLGGAPLNRAAWEGESFNVTTPDGKTTNYPIGASDPVGGGYIEYTPTEVGTYTVISLFPATWKNSTNPTNSFEAGYPNIEDQYYSAAVSAPVTFTVVQNPQPAYPESPLPTGPWTFPISNAARTWSVLPGNWLGGAWEQPAGQAGGTTLRYEYGTPDLTSHIIWSYPYYAGGDMDARFGDISYETGHYQGLDFSAIILDGLMYTPNRIDAYREQGYYVIDLYTGQIESYQNSTMPSFGQIYNYASPNQSGGYPILWVTSGITPPPGVTSTSSWEMLDGYTLHPVCYIGNVSATGTQVVGPMGEICYYALHNYGTTANPNYHITVWNDTNVIGETATPPGTGTTYWQWRPEGGGFGGGPALNNSMWFDGNTGFSANYSIPNINNTPNAILNQTASILTVRVGQYVILGTTGQNNELGNVPGQLFCVSDDDSLHNAIPSGHEASKMLWQSSYTAPFASIAENVSASSFGSSLSLVGVYPEDGVMLWDSTKLLTYWGYNMTTGALLWTGAPEPQMNYYSMQNNYYEGMLLTTGYGGVVIAYNITTGQQVWNYTAENIGAESPYGNYPINIFAICGGCIYTLAGEHSITNPLWRGPNVRCINATNGQLIWDTLGFGADNGAHLTGQYMQMGDGYVVGLNYFDGMIYCYGPGNSATTVSAPQSGVAVGSAVTLTGSVTDQTDSGRRNDAGNLDFTLKGTPAISDADMSAYMEYLYEQQPFPTNATGVPVTLSAIDPNGNYIAISTVTSNVDGTYGCSFTPAVPGQYQIIAAFAGSHAYGASSAETYLVAGSAPITAAPTTTPLSESTIASTLMSYLAIAVIAIIVAIAIVGVLILRKHA